MQNVLNIQGRVVHIKPRASIYCTSKSDSVLGLGFRTNESSEFYQVNCNTYEAEPRLSGLSVKSVICLGDELCQLN